MSSQESPDRAVVLRAQREFGRTVKQQCVAADIRQADLAAELGIHDTVFSAVINGRRVWQAGIDDLKEKVAQAIARVAVSA
ncbi:MAG: helix-turn-helix domain-containing protein [Sandaracinaceae bacterium]